MTFQEELLSSAKYAIVGKAYVDWLASIGSGSAQINKEYTILRNAVESMFPDSPMYHAGESPPETVLKAALTVGQIWRLRVLPGTRRERPPAPLRIVRVEEDAVTYVSHDGDGSHWRLHRDFFLENMELVIEVGQLWRRIDSDDNPMNHVEVTGFDKAGVCYKTANSPSTYAGWFGVSKWLETMTSVLDEDLWR